MVKKEINCIKTVLVENKRTAKWLAGKWGEEPRNREQMVCQQFAANP